MFQTLKRSLKNIFINKPVHNKLFASSLATLSTSFLLYQYHSQLYNRNLQSQEVQQSNITQTLQQDLQEFFDLDIAQENSQKLGITRDMRLFAGGSSKELGKEIATQLDIQLGRVILGKEDNGGQTINILDSVRGKRVYVVQSFSQPVHESLMELLLLVSALKRAFAAEITCIVPFMGYVMGDSSPFENDLIEDRDFRYSANIAKFFQEMGCDNVITINLHNPEIRGNFDIPITNIDAMQLSIPYIMGKKLQNVVVCAQEATKNQTLKSLKMVEHLKQRGVNAKFGCLIQPTIKSEKFSQKQLDGILNIDMIEKSFQKKNVPKIDYIGPNVKDKDVLIVDSIIDSGKSLLESSHYLKQKGAKRIFFYATHGIFSHRDVVNNIQYSYVNDLIVTNSVQAPDKILELQNVTQISIGKLLAEVIAKLETGLSLEDARIKNNKTQ